MENQNTLKEKWIMAVLANDETSTDEELISYFMEEGKMTMEEAKVWISKRSFYLCNVVLDDGRLYDPRLNKKTNKHWYPYEEYGCYYRLEDGFLLQCAMNRDGTADEESVCEIDWVHGVSGEEVPRLKKVIEELYQKD